MANSNSFISATPSSPIYNISLTNPKKQQVKVATPDIILFDNDSVPFDVIPDLIFEEIGGHELINISRSDIVNGQKVSYTLIKNLDRVEQIFNPKNLINLQQTSDKYFANFPISLDLKIPKTGSNAIGNNVYLDSLTGDLLINLVNIRPEEQVEIQITQSGTIYEAEL